ncbi:hypothetical protein FG386_003197 [Cryptosporidium ryanae]|uniref:uncharacterized protein n=1 Tax=Cryptosporidium ryanae TaxID=515981 RepID=UPI00351A9761|nr:hypothetical protein FG386_003197 [Cryptosporidium ryanae]
MVPRCNTFDNECDFTQIDKHNAFNINFTSEEFKDQIYYELINHRYISFSNYNPKIRNVFKIFSTQINAIEYFKSLSLHFGRSHLELSQDRQILPISIFSEEIGINGTRRYIVSSFESIWSYINSLNNLNRHLYEVILEDQLCWLYFDIEYNKTLYSIDDCDLVTMFTRNLLRWFSLRFNHYIDKSDIIYLNSTTKKKFSYHIIVKHIDTKKKFSTLFINNLSMKIFVQHFIYYLIENQIGMANGNFLLHRIVDMGVYSRNRCLRTLFSSKFGKNVPFKIDKEHTNYKISECPPIQFFRSMVTFLDIDDFNSYDFLSKEFIINKYCINIREIGLLNRMADILHHISKDTNIHRIKDNFPNHLVKILEYSISYWNNLRDLNRLNSKNISNYEMITELSMNDIKLDFSQNIRTEIRSCIYSIYYIRERDILIVLPNKSNKLCLNVGREHRSNGIKIIIKNSDLCFYQKCFDPDCIEYRSRYFNIPTILSDYANDVIELNRILV